MLTPLQHHIAAVFAHLPEAEGFALAGGAALIARGDVDRLTHDLDFFATEATAVDMLLPALEQALRDDGMAVERVQVNHGFARLAVTDHGERTDVDLCVDYRLLPTEVGPLGPTLAGEELAVNKLLALFSRAEARDFVDLAAVEPRYGLTHLCARAVEKDAGFDARVLAEMLGRFDRLPPDEFGLDDDALNVLRQRVARWRQALGQ